jgi:hypothetical protein
MPYFCITYKHFFHDRMAHIARGPHDEIFYKLLEELKQETEILMASGYRGEGFYSDGHNLGSRSVPQYLSKQIAAAAAEKRLQTAKIMLPSDGVRLGGGTKSPLMRNMTPAQRAASAAEKRLRDKIWCGGSVENEGDSSPISSAASSPASSSSTSTAAKRKFNNGINRTSKSNNATSPISISGGNTTATPTKKTRVTIDLTSDDDESITANHDDIVDGWSCPTCTFINKALLLACQVCLSERPIIKDDTPSSSLLEEINNGGYWKCPQCTLLNEKKWTACTACTFINLK